MSDTARIKRLVDEIYRRDSRRVLATLIRLLRDFDLAEEALHDAFVAAAANWTEESIPANPVAWLVSAGRYKTIDRLRRRGRFDAAIADVALRLEGENVSEPAEEIEDDRLRLIFTCCHPAIPGPAQVAMTLREVCGLTTEEIASAFLTTGPTVAQRIVRAKAKIRELRIPYETPERNALAERAAAVLRVVYLVFNEGYAASHGADLLRTDLSSEAIRLGRLVVELSPSTEARGLLALMLINDSRRHARIDASGDLVLLEDQDRTLWDRDEIAEGLALAAAAIAAPDAGSYTLQAAIAGEHARAATVGATDWKKIVALYDRLLMLTRSPVVALNRAVAIGMGDGPEHAIALIRTLLEGDVLDGYHLAHAALGDMHRRLGERSEARVAFEKALSLCHQDAERRFLSRRLSELA